MLLSAPIFQLKRRSKLLARDANIPLHEAQDRIAQKEGFRSWSMLSSRAASQSMPAPLLQRLVAGDMLLIGARPGHGKTMLGLRLLIDAAQEGRRAVLFSLEYTEGEAIHHMQSLGATEHPPEIVTSDDISAGFIIEHLTGSPRGTVAVIDYLQALDQQRTKPALDEQVKSLSRFAKASGVVFAFISQIDRSFNTALNALPGVSDIRFPNAVPVGLFSKACFLHAGKMRVREINPL